MFISERTLAILLLYIYIYIYIFTYKTTLRVIRRLRGGGELTRVFTSAFTIVLGRVFARALT